MTGELDARDHKRGCPQRQAACTCGYEAALEAALTTARAETARLREALAHYACKCSAEAHEHCCYGEGSVTCGYRARAALAERTGFNEPTPHVPQYPFEIEPSAKQEKTDG